MKKCGFEGTIALACLLLISSLSAYGRDDSDEQITKLNMALRVSLQCGSAFLSKLTSDQKVDLARQTVSIDEFRAFLGKISKEVPIERILEDCSFSRVTKLDDLDSLKLSESILILVGPVKLNSAQYVYSHSAIMMNLCESGVIYTLVDNNHFNQDIALKWITEQSSTSMPAKAKIISWALSLYGDSLIHRDVITFIDNSQDLLRGIERYRSNYSSADNCFLDKIERAGADGTFQFPEGYIYLLCSSYSKDACSDPVLLRFRYSAKSVICEESCRSYIGEWHKSLATIGG